MKYLIYYDICSGQVRLRRFRGDVRLTRRVGRVFFHNWSGSWISEEGYRISRHMEKDGVLTQIVAASIGRKYKQ